MNTHDTTRLQDLGKRRQRLAAQMAALDEELKPEIFAAAQAKVPQKLIINWTGMARESVRLASMTPEQREDERAVRHDREWKLQLPDDIDCDDPPAKGSERAVDQALADGKAGRRGDRDLHGASLRGPLPRFADDEVMGLCRPVMLAYSVRACMAKSGVCSLRINGRLHCHTRTTSGASTTGRLAQVQREGKLAAARDTDRGRRQLHPSGGVPQAEEAREPAAFRFVRIHGERDIVAPARMRHVVLAAAE